MKIFQLVLTPLLLFPFCLFGQIVFTPVTDPDNPAVSYTNTQAAYKGAVWIDLNHDNKPDLFASQKFLFQNTGSGQFVQLPDVMGATLGQAASGSSWGDIDNDGDLDGITASTVAGLHYNNGDNNFTLRNALLPNFESYRAWDCSLADADNNGLLDLFWAHADNFPPGSVQQPCKFYLQTQKDSFKLITGYEFAEEFRPYTIPVWTDYDLDGDVDLFIGSGPGGAPGPDFCYKNLLKETGIFGLQRLTQFPFDSLQDGQVYNSVDFDNDGDMDICLTNYSGASTHFYLNENGSYQEMHTPFSMQGPFLTNVWGDVDNDGDLDVLISVDQESYVRLYRNDNGFFSDYVQLGPSGNGVCGVALADYDNDGDLDLYTNGATTARGLMKNESNLEGNHWSAFTLEGQQSNRSAIGAKLRLKTTVNGHSVWQIREVSAHNSFQSQSDLRQHFGLGAANVIDTLVVSWPSGLEQKFGQLAMDNFYKLVEGKQLEVQPVNTQEPEDLGLKINPNPVDDSFELSLKKGFKQLQLFDTTGKITHIQPSIFGKNASVRLPEKSPSGHYFLKITLENGASVVTSLIKI